MRHGEMFGESIRSLQRDGLTRAGTGDCLERAFTSAARSLRLRSLGRRLVILIPLFLVATAVALGFERGWGFDGTDWLFVASAGAIAGIVAALIIEFVSNRRLAFDSDAIRARDGWVIHVDSAPRDFGKRHDAVIGRLARLGAGNAVIRDRWLIIPAKNDDVDYDVDSVINGAAHSGTRFDDHDAHEPASVQTNPVAKNTTDAKPDDDSANRPTKDDATEATITERKEDGSNEDR